MKKRILVVEDDKRIREVICFYLNKSGYEVLQTDNGIQALQLVAEEKPGLIVLDIMLPGISGLEICKILKSDATTKDIAIVFLSAKGKSSEKSLGLGLGANVYITKPFSLKHLLKKINELYSPSCSDIIQGLGRS